MRISGLQKLTALDFPDRLACTVFTPGCNLRCPFCHNASLVLKNAEDYNIDEFFSFLKKRTGVLDGVCITGGEPLLQPGIEEFISKIRELGYLVKLDTNGAFPDKLESIISKGLVDYVAMDIKNSPEKYPASCGIDKNSEDFLLPFKKSIALLLQNKVDYEFRTTVVEELHEISDIEKAGELIRGARRWNLQCFKDSGDLISSGFSSPTKRKLEQMKEVALGFCDSCDIRGV